jgi:hypothetical protein
MVVVPNLFSRETGKPDAAAAEPLPPLSVGAEFGPQAARRRRSPAAATEAVCRIESSRTADPFCW